eukprot:Colp12_sorted_trinity150504_noHs@27779
MVRFKNRYFLIELDYGQDGVDTTLSSKDITQALKDMVYSLYGDYGLGCLIGSLSVKYFNVATGLVIVRCARDYHTVVASTISFTTSLKKRPCALRTVHLGGTIESCQKAALKYSQERGVLLLSRCKTKDEEDKVNEVLQNAMSEIRELTI